MESLPEIEGIPERTHRLHCSHSIPADSHQLKDKTEHTVHVTAALRTWAIALNRSFGLPHLGVQLFRSVTQRSAETAAVEPQQLQQI